ncbi:hypothetical protein BDR06DRAFT_1004301 [Suillus hirtellus]|nr:hypothetical protein BDR06DRAFT_1004301 [Suillus hirtellus]
MLGCNKGDHDHTHCYGKGGGMEGQAPWMKNKTRRDAVAAAAVTVPTPAALPPSTVTPAIAAAGITGLTSLMDNLSFASIAEVPDNVSCITGLPFTMILDSGITLMLVKDCRFFHTYSSENTVSMTTANHGILQVTGCRSCVVWWTIGGQ